MRCDKCLTEVRFSKSNELFFFTPEGNTPCGECKAKFDKIKAWARKMPVELNVAMVEEFSQCVLKLKSITNRLEVLESKASLWQLIKRIFIPVKKTKTK